MQGAFSHMELILGRQKTDALAKARIAVFGVGGVGSFVTEALARCGVGSLTLVDHDSFSEDEICRQLYATRSMIGQSKVSVAGKHIHDIDENILVHCYETAYSKQTAPMFDLTQYDYIVDTLPKPEDKLVLIEEAVAKGVKILSCMCLNRFTDISRLTVADITKASVCPVAKELRAELRKAGIRSLKVLFSSEARKKGHTETEEGPDESAASGSICYLTGAAGLMIAREVVRDITDSGEPAIKRPRIRRHGDK